MVVVLFAFLKERVIRSIKIFNHLSVRLSKPIRCEFKSQNIKKPPNEDLLCRQYGCFWSKFQPMRLSLTGIWTSQLFLCQDFDESGFLSQGWESTGRFEVGFPMNQVSLAFDLRKWDSLRSEFWPMKFFWDVDFKQFSSEKPSFE
jgi:hypothetical protein